MDGWKGVSEKTTQNLDVFFSPVPAAAAPRGTLAHTCWVMLLQVSRWQSQVLPIPEADSGSPNRKGPPGQKIAPALQRPSVAGRLRATITVETKRTDRRPARLHGQTVREVQRGGEAHIWPDPPEFACHCSSVWLLHPAAVPDGCCPQSAVEPVSDGTLATNVAAR